MLYTYSNTHNWNITQHAGQLVHCMFIASPLNLSLCVLCVCCVCVYMCVCMHASTHWTFLQAGSATKMNVTLSLHCYLEQACYWHNSAAMSRADPFGWITCACRRRLPKNGECWCKGWHHWACHSPWSASLLHKKSAGRGTAVYRWLTAWGSGDKDPVRAVCESVCVCVFACRVWGGCVCVCTDVYACMWAGFQACLHGVEHSVFVVEVPPVLAAGLTRIIHLQNLNNVILIICL